VVLARHKEDLRVRQAGRQAQTGGVEGRHARVNSCMPGFLPGGTASLPDQLGGPS
jgi:hypothetical protein